MILRFFVALWFACCLVPLTVANAGAAPQVVRVDPVLSDGKLEINADINFDLNPQLRDAALRGVSLYFTADLVITEPRWWWFNRNVVQIERTSRVSYNALTRQWRVSIDDVGWPVGSLDEAMQLITRMRGWQVAEAGQFEPGEHYTGTLRLRLDTSQLARPFQVNALNSSSWSVETPWANFSFAVSASGDAP